METYLCPYPTSQKQYQTLIFPTDIAIQLALNTTSVRTEKVITQVKKDIKPCPSKKLRTITARGDVTSISSRRRMQVMTRSFCMTDHSKEAPFE